ncbi:MAG: iron chelate uptake ABC transporter family permease subunit [Opitutaceae bacterium]|nr:iron chelate uptake ABC transporter family permease subunit [Opitutaceae bacterium]
MNRTGKQILFALALLALPFLAHAAKIGEISETTWTDQAIDFFTMQQPIVRTALTGSLLIGFCCGILGSFLVVRKLSLLGDTLSHAVLPGVAMGFLWNASKDPWAIFVGATAAGILGVALVGWIKQTTHLKEDSTMGMVLAGFYGVGICMTTVIQNMAMGNKSGLDKFFFGQAAALSSGDIELLSIIALITVVVILGFYKEFLVISFDSGFAQVLGMPVKVLHYALMALLTFAVVVSLQAVGVVLVSALLITPAAAAFLLTDRMHWMLVLAAAFGMLAGAIGAFVSYLSNNLPTGPFIVLGATGIFMLALLFGPRHGLLPKMLRRRKQRQRIALENTLKAVFHLSESSQFKDRVFEIGRLATERNATLHETESEIRNLVKAGMALCLDSRNGPEMSGQAQFELTKSGWYRACEIVRNHRLWELYLTNAAQYPKDHVHDDAEDIEHHLGEELVHRIEERLENPIHDPHGKLIPNRDAIKL